MMIETMTPAVVAICQCIIAYGGFLSWETIDRVVFYGVADEHLLQSMLREMAKDGLLKRISNGCFDITDRGRRFVEQQT